MTEEQQQSAPTEHLPITDEETSGESTPEAIEAYWKNRAAGADRKRAAIEAENRVLREQATVKGATPAAPASGDNPLQAEVERLSRELEETRTAAVVGTRQAKYPDAAEALGDPRVLAIFDEAKLASLQEQLRAEPSKRPVGASNPARTMTTQKPVSEMSVAELRSYMKTIPIPGQALNED